MGNDLLSSRLLAFRDTSELVTRVQSKVEEISTDDKKVCVGDEVPTWLGFDIFSGGENDAKCWRLEYSIYAMDDDSSLKVIFEKLNEIF